MRCERSVITMTLHWHSSQVFSLSNCVDDTLTEGSPNPPSQLVSIKLMKVTIQQKSDVAGELKRGEKKNKEIESHARN